MASKNALLFSIMEDAAILKDKDICDIDLYELENIQQVLNRIRVAYAPAPTAIKTFLENWTKFTEDSEKTKQYICKHCEVVVSMDKTLFESTKECPVCRKEVNWLEYNEVVST